jgi:hypothetical protein
MKRGTNHEANPSFHTMKRVFLNIFTLLVLSALNAQAATYYVATTGNDNNSGTQTQPFRTIAKGIAAAANGETVFVANGTYNEHDLDFGAKNLTLRSESGNPADCILDCQTQGSGIKIAGGQTTATVSGLTIRNGRTSNIDGAAINISNSSATIANCVVSACKAFLPATGDGVYVFRSPGVTITGCTFSGNGGEWVSFGAVSGSSNDRITISDCIFTGNPSGAMHFQSSDAATITRCTFTNNSSRYWAGGISWQFYGVVSVDRCVFTGNQGNDAQGPQAGAIFFNEGDLTVTNSLFVGNSPRLEDDSAYAASILLWNHQNRPLSAKIANCTMIANDNLNIDANVVIDCPQFSDGRPNLTVTNCILRGTFQYGDFANFNFAKIEVTYSNLQLVEWQPGVGNIGADPKFVNPAGGDYRLQSSSPCLNTGTASVPGLPATDLDGGPRILGSAPDMGAYELWTASAGVWFVDKVLGSDTNPGSPSAPFKTVVKAVNSASNGHKIYIKAGNYGTDRPRITKSLRLFNWGNTGQARIGKP